MKYVKTVNGEIGFANCLRPNYYEVKTVCLKILIYHESDLTEISEEEYEEAWDEARLQD